MVETENAERPRPELAAGSRIGGYRIEAVIGRGGMGVVYRAVQVALERIVAVKVIAPEIAAHVGFRRRFETEAKVAASLDHPNVLPVYEAGEHDGLLFVSMRYVDGPDLGALLRESGPLAPARAVAIVVQIAEALDVAHTRGVVHRDVKPGNVLVERRNGREHAYLADFGLAKTASVASASATVGTVVGTLDYASPEQIRGEPLSASSDVYSLGCLFWETLRGRPPFAREDDLAKLWAHMHDPPPPLGLRGLEQLDEVLQRAMAKQPNARFQSAHAFAEAAAAAEARAVRATRPKHPRRSPRLAKGVIAGIAAGAVAAGFLAGKGAWTTVKTTLPLSDVATTGVISLELPVSWQRLSGNAGIRGITFQPKPLYLAPRGRAAPGGLLAGSTSAPGPTFLSKQFIALAAPAGIYDRDVVRLGDYEAFRYRFVHAPGSTTALVLYVVPAGNTTTIACFAPTKSDPLLRACESIAASLTILGGKSISLQGDQEYAAALNAILLKLDHARKDGLAALRAAKTRTAQSAGARTISAAYAAASMALLRLHIPASEAGPNDTIADATARAAAAYTALAAAAAGGSPQSYSSATYQIRSAELNVRKSIDGLAAHGYDLRPAA